MWNNLWRTKPTHYGLPGPPYSTLHEHCLYTAPSYEWCLYVKSWQVIYRPSLLKIQSLSAALVAKVRRTQASTASSSLQAYRRGLLYMYTLRRSVVNKAISHINPRQNECRHSWFRPSLCTGCNLQPT